MIFSHYFLLSRPGFAVINFTTIWAIVELRMRKMQGPTPPFLLASRPGRCLVSRLRFCIKRLGCVNSSLQTGECSVHAARIKNGFQTIALLAFEWTASDPGFT